jgi:hypothetical protein
VQFSDDASYSDDEMYRWWYERRWNDGALLCWVGLNPGTGDTDGKPRPTLNKVVEWADAAGCGAVRVVNLFAYRSTNPKVLRTTTDDIVGRENDDVIRKASELAEVTLAAWGAGGTLLNRGARVTGFLSDPVCLGLTKNGEPRHPLYVAQATAFVPYVRS